MNDQSRNAMLARWRQVTHKMLDGKGVRKNKDGNRLGLRARKTLAGYRP